MEFATTTAHFQRLMTPALGLTPGQDFSYQEKRMVDTNVWLIAAVWMALALAASIISIRVGISVALIEILLGILAGNVFHVQTTAWIDFLATFGAGLLTFLAGAEIDPTALRRHLKPALLIGAVSFALPFLAAGAFAYWLAGWSRDAAYIAGIALSTTSVAVVYT